MYPVGKRTGVADVVFLNQTNPVGKRTGVAGIVSLTSVSSRKADMIHKNGLSLSTKCFK